MRALNSGMTAEFGANFSKKYLNILVFAFLAIGLLIGGLVVQTNNAKAEITSFLYDFDDEDQLYDEFSLYYDEEIYYSEDDGLSGSGAIDVGSIGFDGEIAIASQPFSQLAEGETYSVSSYFRNNGNGGYGGLGFTYSKDTDGFGSISGSNEAGLGVSFHGGGGDFASEGEDIDTSLSWSGGDLENQWYKMVFEITSKGEDTYDLKFQIFPSDSDGELSAIKTEHVIEDVTNEDLGAASRIYAYFAIVGTDRFDRVDNFEVEAAAFTMPAPTAIRSYTNEETGDVFLGGDFIELGISRYGSFGTAYEQPMPNGFFGTDVRENIGMSTNPSGFGVAPDLRMDFFMPGSEEERWVVGYEQGEEQFTASNAYLSSSTDIEDNVVTDQSSGNNLMATSIGTYEDTLETKQVISFGRTDRFFKNEVTLKNVSSNTIESARYMRSFDPDNTVDQGGDYTTNNQILYTHEAGDGKAVVVADTSWTDDDPVYMENGSRSPILFYSSDPRARVSTFGFGNDDPYDPLAYDEALAKGQSVVDDQAITITFDLGNLSPGQSKTFIYYTSLDNGDIEEIISNIEQADATNDLNGDNIIDDQQVNVRSFTSSVTGKSVVLEVDSVCTIDEALVRTESFNTVQDAGYDYPNGIMGFSVDCGEPGYVAVVKQYYYEVDPSGLVARKYNPNNNSYFNIPGATVSTVSIYSQPVTVLTYLVADGGPLDVDGEVDGFIIDPAGLAIASTGTPNTGIGGRYTNR